MESFAENPIDNLVSITYVTKRGRLVPCHIYGLIKAIIITKCSNSPDITYFPINCRPKKFECEFGGIKGITHIKGERLG